MLELLTVSKYIQEEIKIDKYIPLKIRWKNPNIFGEGIVYWRTGDLKKSMLEIGISLESGEIRSITIVSADKIIYDTIKPIAYSNIIKGIPVFNIELGAEISKIDDVGLFEIHYNHNTIKLMISESEIKSIVVSGRVIFGIDNDSTICAVFISPLTKIEIEQFEDTLKYYL